MRKACVIGYPLSHSLSPALHTYWLRKYAIEGEYTARVLTAEQLPEFIKNLAGQGYAGRSVTIPHKETVMPFLDEIDDAAKAIGAVNTIIVKPDGKLKGTNTNVNGFMQNLKSHGPLAHKNKAVVLGAGGAAKAVVKALADEGFKEIIVANRTPDKTKILKGVIAASWDQRSTVLAGADLLVNTTSLGMKGSTPLDIDLSLLPPGAIVSDIVYNPLVTPLLEAARARGNVAIDGLGMLIWQAVPAFEAWFGKKPEVTGELRNYLL